MVHFGIVLLFIGFAGQAFNVDIQEEVAIGDTVSLRQYTLQMEEFQTERTANYDLTRVVVRLFEDGVQVANMYPELRVYQAIQQTTHEVSIRATLQEDLYVVFAGISDSGSPIMQVYLNPLVSWVWIGGVIIGLGTLIALLPNKRTAPSKRARASRRKQKDEVSETEKVHA